MSSSDSVCLAATKCLVYLGSGSQCDFGGMQARAAECGLCSLLCSQSCSSRLLIQTPTEWAGKEFRVRNQQRHVRLVAFGRYEHVASSLNALLRGVGWDPTPKGARKL